MTTAVARLRGILAQTMTGAQIDQLLDQVAAETTPVHVLASTQELATARYAADLEEIRDLLESNGYPRVHGDDWPDLIPAVTALIAERKAEERRADAEGLAGAGIHAQMYRHWQSTIVEARRQKARADVAEARIAWLAGSHGDGLDLIVRLGDELEPLRERLAAVRAYADDLYSAPRKVNACGVRERLLDILTPPGPTITFEEAMAGRAPKLSDEDLRGGFWPDMTGGLCSACHVNDLRGQAPDPDCPRCPGVRDQDDADQPIPYPLREDTHG